MEQTFQIIASEDSKRLNDALKKLSISHKTFKKYYYKDLIRVDGKRVMHIDPVKAGSVISFRIPGSMTPISLDSENPEILYEDDFLFLMNKPAMILTHESKYHDGVNFKDYATKAFNEKQIGEPVRFINRLDMDTSGIIMIAKHDIAQGFYQKLHEKGEIIKEYICICRSKAPLEKKTSVNVPIERDEIGIKRKAGDHESGKEAKTIFTPLYYKEGYEILKAEIKTGRTHQIRVHLGTMDKVLIGDELYGDNHDLIERQALHSYRLRTRRPDGKKLDVFCPLPEDMQMLIRKIFKK